MEPAKEDSVSYKLSLPLDELIKQDSLKPESSKLKDTKETKAKPDKANRVFVGNLSFKTSWQTLKDHMRSAGEVVYVDIFSKPDGQSKGCGIVEYKSHMEAERALQQLHETKLDGRSIYVREDNKEGAEGGKRNRSNPGNHDRDRGERNKDRGDRGDRIKRSRSRDRERERRRSASNERKYGRGDRSRNDDRDRGYEIVVKNIPWTVSWQQLKDAFREFGNIVRADVPQDKKGRSVGYGLVKFERERDARAAKENMDGASFNGRIITVKLRDKDD